MKTKKIRLILLGVLLGGLLLAGVGAGVTAYEFTSFTYGGAMVPETAEVQTRKETFRVGEQYQKIAVFFWGYHHEGWPVRVEEDPTLTPGTLQVETRYTAVPGVQVWYDSYDSGEDRWDIGFVWSGSGLGVALTMKDQVLEDLRQRTLREYQIAEVQEQIITVNPVDRGRLDLPDGLQSDGTEPTVVLN